ncbi:MAG TPA: NifU family protein [Nitrospiria bacterium]|nr:NifU family protein [Nitrospiria bacterium]
MLTMTPEARDKILAVLNDPARKSYGLRLTVTPNGQSTPQYGLSLVDKETPGLNDMVFTVDGIRFYLDRLSTPYVDGATIDYTNGAQGEGFVIKTAAKPKPPRPQLPPELAGSPPTGPDAEAIQKLLDEQINPGLASHGGEATLVAIKDNIVYVTMSGGCQGCGSATLTLKQGITSLIKKELPHIKDVLDVTDHAAGKNPFYRPNI